MSGLNYGQEGGGDRRNRVVGSSRLLKTLNPLLQLPELLPDLDIPLSVCLSMACVYTWALSRPQPPENDSDQADQQQEDTGEWSRYSGCEDLVRCHLALLLSNSSIMDLVEKSPIPAETINPGITIRVWQGTTRELLEELE